MTIDPKTLDPDVYVPAEVRYGNGQVRLRYVGRDGYKIDPDDEPYDLGPGATILRLLDGKPNREALGEAWTKGFRAGEAHGLDTAAWYDQEPAAPANPYEA